MQQIEWQVAEWDDDGTAHEGHLDGINGEVSPALPDGSKWFWMVRPGGTRSETPEVYSSGTETTEEAAREAAEKSMREADASYEHPFRNL